MTDVGANGLVTLALRPEGIELGEGEPGENRLHGTVEDINFLGSIVRIRVKVGDGEDGGHRRYRPRRVQRAAPPAPRRRQGGDDLLPPEACFVLGAARDGALASSEVGAEV